jgi:hypothetical protein
MDPDMVRQQEEAEEEARRLTMNPAPVAVAAAAPPSPPASAPRPAPRSEEPETVLTHVHIPGLPPVIPVLRKKKRPAPPADTRSRIGWSAALRASLYALIMTGLGLLVGIPVGVQLGFSPIQSLAVGAALGFLLGWRSAFASLRANKQISFGRAMLVSVSPALIVLAGLLAAFLIATHFTGATSNSMTNLDFWIVVGSGALFTLLLSTARTRRLTFG